MLPSYAQLLQESKSEAHNADNRWTLYARGTACGAQIHNVTAIVCSDNVYGGAPENDK